MLFNLPDSLSRRGVFLSGEDSGRLPAHMNVFGQVNVLNRFSSLTNQLKLDIITRSVNALLKA